MRFGRVKRLVALERRMTQIETQVETIERGGFGATSRGMSSAEKVATGREVTGYFRSAAT